jgi:hypothetical protein
VSVREVFAERNYNTVVDADGNRNLIVEHLLAEHVEDGAAYGPCFARFQRGERSPASLSYTLLLPV